MFCLDIIASHYRKAIFQMMGNVYDVTYLFGKSIGNIKTIDTSKLKGETIITNTIYFGKGWYWQPGLVSRLFFRFDCYILNGETRALSTWMFCLLALLLGKRKRVFFWSHGWYGKETKIEKLVKNIYFHLPGGGIFLYGNYARELMIKEGFNPNKLYVIHNSLDYEVQSQLRMSVSDGNVYEEHFCNKNKNIIFIGRLTKVKRLDLLIDAIEKLKKEGNFINVTLIGDGTQRFFLENLVKEKELSNQIWFYGASYDEKINAQLIYNADLCVSPGNVGLTAMHVMMFGCPVITHDDFTHQMPEFESIIDGETGSFFRAGDSTSLAASINDWIAKHGNNRGQVRKACMKQIDEQWTPQFQMDVLNTVLNH